MKVQKLIEELQKLDQEKVVYLRPLSATLQKLCHPEEVVRLGHIEEMHDAYILSEEPL